MALPSKTDGTFSFYGGMDLSRVSYEVGERQYVNGVNLSITTVGDNLQPRPGWHWQTIQWRSPREQEIFETGHVQGGSWYFDGSSDCLVVSVSGYLFFFNQKTQGNWYGKILNFGAPNNSTRTKVYCCRIPGNRLIVSDGQSLPYVLGSGGGYVRTDPNAGQMSVCRMMTYVQNRLWWVDETGTIIYGSDIQDPLSIQEALDTNVFGFVPPDDRDRITAIGTQRYVNFDQNGGELVFSTQNNVYAVNIPASVPRQEWGLNQNVGTVRLVIPQSGATSAYSFENYNTNLFFRTSATGVANYKQTQAQWQNNDELISNSIEVDYYYSADTPWMLDQCWTVNFKGRLLTTTSPTLHNGYCYWRGIISMNPAPYYGSLQRLPRRFEGLWTGVQPWCFLHQTSTIEKLFTVSLDGDKKNRIYELVENDHYDIGPGDVKVPIQCILETRAYAFESIYQQKSMGDKFYNLDRIRSDVAVKVYSRSSITGRWWPFYEVVHQVGRCCDQLCLPYNPVPDETRNGWYLPEEVEQVDGGTETRFFYRQFRFEMSGEFELSAFGLSATFDNNKTAMQCDEGPRITVTEPICPLSYFNYFIVPPLIIPDYPGEGTDPIYKTPPKTSASCGC